MQQFLCHKLQRESLSILFLLFPLALHQFNCHGIGNMFKSYVVLFNGSSLDANRRKTYRKFVSLEIIVNTPGFYFCV